MVRARTSSPQRGRTLSPHWGTGLLPAAPPQRVCASIRLGRGFPLAPGHATENACYCARRRSVAVGARA